MSDFLRDFLGRFIKRGDLEIETAAGTRFRVGDGTGTPAAIRFVDAGAQWRFLANPELAFGELFMDERVIPTRGTIFDALMIGARNLLAPDQPRWLKTLQDSRTLLRRLSQRNTFARARRNVSHHYDLDGRLYDLFLDADRQYSCSYFEDIGQGLDESQLAKKRHIAAKLLLAPDLRVLDIGCGWGGLGLYLAERTGARVVGVTLSEEQLAVARERARTRGLEDRVEFRLQDYRVVPETFDRIVSVGMFEHVGLAWYDEYFGQIARKLADDGVALVHTIGATTTPIPTNPWILKYIFPGGYVPTLSEIAPAIERAGLIVADVEVLRLHYAETLRRWRDRFMARRAEAAALYDERFCRMWEFYLSMTEAAFRVGINVVFQIQLVKSVEALPITRDYMARTESGLRETDGPIKG